MSTTTYQTEAKVAAARSLDSHDDESLLEHVPHRAQRLMEQANSQFRDIASATECYVRREPTKALAIAAAVGGLLGVVLNRMR